MSELGPISEACEKSLAAAKLTPRDGAAAALCRRYAALIDDAERLAVEAERAGEALSLDDIEGRRRLARLEIAVAAQSVASDLGPKLLAGLTALGCTLAGRGEKGTGANHAASPAAIALAGIKDEIGARRASNAGRAH
jgi:hypothetical protein